MAESIRLFHYSSPFTLESGEVLPVIKLAYTTHGSLNADRDNVIWVFHALTANADPTDWWEGLVGRGLLIDPDEHFIVCVNMPGSCYGSTSPLDNDPRTRAPFYYYFPFFTTRDMIRAYQYLRRALGIKRIQLGIGGSMGGQQLLEWAIEEPGLFKRIVPIATNAEHSPWGRAFNASQRLAIENDPTWGEHTPDAGIEGMKVARSIALLSYRNYKAYSERQRDTNNEPLRGLRSESYQRYQGEKLSKRFNAFSYYALSRSMDSHNVGRKRGGTIEALSAITAKTLVIGVETDILFPIEEQRYLAANIPNAAFSSIHSDYGHDGFLLENDQITDAVLRFAPELCKKKHWMRAIRA